MSQMNVDVVPSPYVVTSTITNLQIRVINLVLFTSVSLNVILLSNNDYIDAKTYILEGTEYTNWSNDDNYIVEYVLTQLGLTQLGVPQPDITQPDITQPDITQPDITQPDILPQPDITQPDITQPDITQPDITQPDITQPDLPQVETTTF